MRKRTMITIVLVAMLGIGGVLWGSGDVEKLSQITDSAEVKSASPSAESPGRASTRPMRHGPRSRRRMTDEEEAEALELLKQHRPEHHEQLLRLREEDPRRYRRALRDLHMFFRRWRETPEEVRDAMIQVKDARISISRKLRQIKGETDAEKTKQLKQELRQAVAEHFEAEQNLREKRLAHLAEQIKQLQAKLKEDTEQREQIIDERVERWLTQPKRPARGRRWREGPGRDKPRESSDDLP